jgi:putative membrane protein
MIKKEEWTLLIFNLLYIIGFALYYVFHQNYEFALYTLVLVILLILVILFQRRINFPLPVLWMVSIWGLLHMLGGGLRLPSGVVLYRWIPLEIYNAHDALGEFVILKFDQVLHFYIYFVMSFVLAHLLRFITRTDIKQIYFYFFCCNR